jgi:hypothetical protein
MGMGVFLVQFKGTGVMGQRRAPKLGNSFGEKFLN